MPTTKKNKTTSVTKSKKTVKATSSKTAKKRSVLKKKNPIAAVETEVIVGDTEFVDASHGEVDVAAEDLAEDVSVADAIDALYTDPNDREDEHISIREVLVGYITHRPVLSVTAAAFLLLAVGFGAMSMTSDAALTASVADSIETTGDASVLDAIRKHMVLPDESDPLIATVTDASTLKEEQSFYANVEDGDVVVVFSKARRAVIYSPARDVIVNTGPVVVDGEFNDVTAEGTK